MRVIFALLFFLPTPAWAVSAVAAGGDRSGFHAAINTTGHATSEAAIAEVRRLCKARGFARCSQGQAFTQCMTYALSADRQRGFVSTHANQLTTQKNALSSCEKATGQTCTFLVTGCDKQYLAETAKTPPPQPKPAPL